MHLLIVEDDLPTCDLLAGYLARNGLDVRCAHRLSEGMRLLADGPCCVLLDLSLRDGSGLDLLRHVRALGLPIPVAVVTGLTDASPADAAISQSDALFAKPVDLADLLSWVRKVCRAG